MNHIPFCWGTIKVTRFDTVHTASWQWRAFMVLRTLSADRPAIGWQGLLSSTVLVADRVVTWDAIQLLSDGILCLAVSVFCCCCFVCVCGFILRWLPARCCINLCLVVALYLPCWHLHTWTVVFVHCTPDSSLCTLAHLIVVFVHLHTW